MTKLSVLVLTFAVLFMACASKQFDESSAVEHYSSVYQNASGVGVDTIGWFQGELARLTLKRGIPRDEVEKFFGKTLIRQKNGEYETWLYFVCYYPGFDLTYRSI